MHRVLLLILLPAAMGCSSPAEPSDRDLAEAFQSVLNDSSSAYGVIGAQAAVIMPGRPMWTGVYGRNGETDPMRPDYLISLGSINKMMFATLALRLIDRGLLTLDDTIGQWFPDVPNVPPGVTVRQLLDHTSGIRDYLEDPALGMVALQDPDRVWRAEELLEFIGPPRFAPGTGWEGSNSNPLLLGLIAEGLTGISSGELLRQEVFAPAGILLTWLGGDGNPPATIAAQWNGPPGGPYRNRTVELYGPALHSVRRHILGPAADVATYGQAFFAGGLLSDSLMTEVLRIIPDDGGVPGQIGGGLGIRRYDFFDREIYGHSGATSESNALLLHDQATGITVAVTVNQNGASHFISHFRTGPGLLKVALLKGR